ncbi:MFS general substrate transporter [Mollisia scopiformis]|uniref:MFS general substrate transporter n=1 Tax=Mollisia scopiformis TaxID=149040 RepID=A0A132B654_MOLSC|nr:MFS general substrate transporter [Mollisia scopiformis]KUJ07882.1 MFS general substrate transporter [Mollisia scopiformis]
MVNKHRITPTFSVRDVEVANISVDDSSGVDDSTVGSTSETNPFPDGGLAAWTCVLGSFFALFCTFGWLNALGLFQTYYERTLLITQSASTISWIFTLQLFFMWAGGAVFGRIIDTYGTHHVAIPCAIGCALFVFMINICDQYYQLILVQGVGFGVSAAGLFSCATTSVGQYFDKRKALALGIALSGSSTGGFVHPLYLQRLIDHFGFKQAIRWASLVIAVSGALACMLMSARLPRKKWDKNLSFIDFSLFKRSTFTMYCIGTFFVTWGLFAPWSYLPSMSLRHGFSEGTAIYTIVLLNAASTIGRILPAHLADRLGRFNLVSIITILNAACLLGFWYPLEISTTTAHVQILAFGALYGFTSGAFIGIMMSCVAELGQVETLGQRFGTYQFVVGVGSLTGLPIQGALIPADNHGFRYLILFSGSCMVVGAGFICTARMLRKSRSWKA